MSQVLEDGRASRGSQPLVSAIHIRKLFGRYDYDIVAPAPDRRLILLHGDNGSGKTTILRLIWHLLSPANDQGHRTFIARTPFKSFAVHFIDSTSITVKKSDDLIGPYFIDVEGPNAKESFTAVWPYDRDGKMPRSDAYQVWTTIQSKADIEFSLEQASVSFDESGDVPELQRSLAREEESRERYIAFLRSRTTSPPILLADDRSLYTDDPTHWRVRDRMNVQEERRYAKSSSALPRSSEIVALELRIAIQRVNDVFRSLTLGGQNTGSAGANSIYRDVLSQLASPGLPTASRLVNESESNSRRAEELLAHLAENSPRFEEFNLTPHFAAGDFLKLLGSVPSDRRDLANDILVPYLGSLQARMNALEEAEQLLRSFTTSVNSFLHDKYADFSPREGVRIHTSDNERLDPADLSSGERQLLMLLTTTLLAGRDGNLFIIDEPELSLGVGWQREIVETLLELTAGTRLQLIVATHSVEVVSSQPKSLVKLAHRADG